MKAVDGRLIWQLFLMVREVMPQTADNVARLNEWAQHFHSLEADDTPVPQPREPAPPPPPPPPGVQENGDDEDHDEPQRKPKPKPKKRGKR